MSVVVKLTVCVCMLRHRILAVERVGDPFSQQIIPLKNTARKLLVHPRTQFLVTCETDHQALPESQKVAWKEAVRATYGACVFSRAFVIRGIPVVAETDSPTHSGTSWNGCGGRRECRVGFARS